MEGVDVVKVTGTMINYYFHCKRQCWLFSNKINLEDNSEDVRVGKILHEMKAEETKNTEISIENIKIDKITDDYLVELKKSDADVEAAKWQVLLYLKKLSEKGIVRKGKLEFVEKNKQNRKTVIVELTPETEEELSGLISEIDALARDQSIPEAKFQNKCKKCAYYEYCFI